MGTYIRRLLPQRDGDHGPALCLLTSLLDTVVDRLIVPGREFDPGRGVMKLAMLSASALCVSLTGCGTILESVTNKVADNTVAAAPIAIDPAALLAATSSSATNLSKQEFLGGVVRDSEAKCKQFVDGLVLGENSINTTDDILATVASALSTAFTPPGTKTAFSAAATIASGSKTDIDSDIYAKAAISDFTTAIQKTYYADMQTYTSNLPKLGASADAPLIVNSEIAKLQGTHAECSLGAAESSIQSQLGSTTSQQSNNNTNGAGGAAGNAGSSMAPSNLIQQEPAQQQLNRAASPTMLSIPGHPW